MVVPVKVVFRCVVGRALAGVAALVLAGCWSWIPENPAPAAPAPAEAETSSSAPADSSLQRAGAATASESAGSTDWYTVESGDTLFSIAWRFRVQLSDLAAWNQLGDGSLILVGQRIRLTPPPGYAAAGDGSASRVSGASGQSSAGAAPGSPATAAPATRGGAEAGSATSTGARPSASSGSSAGGGKWQWPAEGRTDVKGARARPGDYGIRILGQRGQDVVASDGGKVMYAGDGLKAYGLLVIVQHTPQWLSAYGHNEKILVKEGEEVRAGQPIATMGVGPGNSAMLHFEIRRDGKPVEPVNLLPKRD